MTAFGEIETGVWDEIGRHRFTAEEIVAFARRYDPQPFHLDAEAASASVLGALCASGWHTAAVFMRLNVDRQRERAERIAAEGRPVPVFGPSPGVSDLRWTSPVRAGDTISYRQRVVSKRESSSRAGWGFLASEVEAYRADDARLVFSMRATVMVRTD